LQPEVVRASTVGALGRSLGDAERVRIQSIAQASASAKLRVASIELVATTPMELLAEALAELEAGRGANREPRKRQMNAEYLEIAATSSYCRWDDTGPRLPSAVLRKRTKT